MVEVPGPARQDNDVPVVANAEVLCVLGGRPGRGLLRW